MVFEHDRRSVLAACAGATLMGVAGCLGGDDGSANGDDGSGTGVDGSGTGGAGESDGWQRFAFEDTGTYTFDFYAHGGERTTLTWSVLEIDGDQVTIGYEMTMEGMTFGHQSTVSVGAGIDEIDPSAAGFFGLTTFHPLLEQFGGETLEVGDGWSHTYEGDTVSYEVTGTDEYAGIGCKRAEIVQNGQTVYETCLSEEHGIAIHTALYEDDGTLAAEQTLVEYSSEPDPSVGENDG